MILLLIVTVVALVSPSEGTKGFIVGGSNATVEEFPFMASIFNLGVSSCGGAIINTRSVLTAAHCILFTTVASVSVVVGSSRRTGEGGTTHRTLRFFIHPDYKFTSPPEFVMTADIAVIRTISQIRFGALVQPIPLGTRAVSSGSQLLLTGWGLTGDSVLRDRADQLQKLEMTSLSNLICSFRFRGTFGDGSVSREKLCVEAQDNRGACGGDSGSPLKFQGTVVGVLSWIVRPCGSHPSVFIRVANHLQWIQQQL